MPYSEGHSSPQSLRVIPAKPSVDWWHVISSGLWLSHAIALNGIRYVTSLISNRGTLVSADWL